MIELLVVLLVLGAAMVVFHPVLVGTGGALRPRTASSRAPAAEGADPEGAGAALAERKERLLRNLRELETERAAGRLSQPDYQALKRKDEAEAAGILRQLEGLAAAARAGKRGGKGAAPRPRPRPRPESSTASGPRRRLRAVLAWAGGSAAFALLLGITMSRALAPRAPGDAATGSLPGEGDGGPTAAGLLFPKGDAARLGELERLLARDSTNVSVLLEAGHLYLAEQRLEEAARVTLKVLSLDPKAPEAHAHIAVLLMAEASSHQDADSARRAINTALQAVNQALSLRPGLAEGWLFKGMILMGGMRDQRGAAEAWERYLQLAPPGADTTRIAALVRGLKRN